ncbi:hypothetical protein I553_3121 [Mycobacterium xenopi 4042]|uniref:Uncharacterized protein n=1 Tax=Mycobacterium xenopi 4042 TaxID=1299334 RepID=X8E3P2_MYCXE|nr:hypothetical protein I553_3121 [Mycobacterium xenopi 4042]
MLGALRLHWLGAELNGIPIDAGQLYDFCMRALGAGQGDTESASPSLSELFAQIGIRDAAHPDDAMEIPVRPQVVNTSGALQGGLIATLADVAAGQLGLRHLPPAPASPPPTFSFAICGRSARALLERFRGSCGPVGVPSSRRSTSSAASTTSSRPRPQ